jgi:hypothetical protein
MLCFALPVLSWLLDEHAPADLRLLSGGCARGICMLAPLCAYALAACSVVLTVQLGFKIAAGGCSRLIACLLLAAICRFWAVAHSSEQQQLCFCNVCWFVCELEACAGCVSVQQVIAWLLGVQGTINACFSLVRFGRGVAE